MLTMNFELNLGDENPHEFELGHLTMEFDGSTIVSKGKVPDQSMMVFIAASDLLGGLTNYVVKKKKYFEFVGCDSSFIVKFSRNKKGNTEIINNKKVFCCVDDKELISSVYTAASELLNKFGQSLDGSGAAKGDLEYSLQDAKKIIEGL